MEKSEFSRRLSQLRINKGVSARDMSLSIGQSAGYINNIENGVNYPAMQSFFYIWGSLNIQRAESGEKVFRQTQQKFARVVASTRRIFVKYHEKDSVNCLCDEFLEVPICDYLGITPMEFFDVENSNPQKTGELLSVLKGLSSDQLDHFIAIARELKKKK